MFAEKTFILATGRKFPYDISIRVCGKDELKKIHETFNGTYPKDGEADKEQVGG